MARERLQQQVAAAEASAKARSDDVAALQRQLEVRSMNLLYLPPQPPTTPSHALLNSLQVRERECAAANADLTQARDRCSAVEQVPTTTTPPTPPPPHSPALCG